MKTSGMMRLAIIVSHPIQYYVPLYQRLAQRDDLKIKVFYTWHAAEQAQVDKGFQQAVAWDIPLTEGYEFETVPNSARQPGTHHFWGLRNPSLVESVLRWQPDAVHITGYAYASHVRALRAFARRKLPVLFRGDSHLLNEKRAGLKWELKRALLSTVFSWPTAFLFVGEANKAYYRAFGVPENKLFYCPHSIEVERFAEPDAELEMKAAAWRRELGIREEEVVLLFAGKLEDKKRPLPLMEAMLKFPLENILLLVGDGEHGAQVKALAKKHPARFRLLPFQNQSRMPVVYRLGDILVLPSAYGETWGLAVNEALACGRAAMVSDKVGCGADLIQPGGNGAIFRAEDWQDFRDRLNELMQTNWREKRGVIKSDARQFSPAATERALVDSLRRILHR